MIINGINVNVVRQGRIYILCRLKYMEADWKTWSMRWVNAIYEEYYYNSRENQSLGKFWKIGKETNFYIKNGYDFQLMGRYWIQHFKISLKKSLFLKINEKYIRKRLFKKLKTLVKHEGRGIIGHTALFQYHRTRNIGFFNQANFLSL